MQEVRRPGGKWFVGSLAVALAGGVLLGVGVVQSRTGVQALGFVVTIAALFLALGTFVVGRALRQGLAALQGGEHFGSWGGQGRPEVDLGATLCVIDGEPVLYAIHFERAVAVVLDDEAGELRIHLTSNDGNGSVEIIRAMPFAPADRAAALAAGQRLATHFGVSPPTG